MNKDAIFSDGTKEFRYPVEPMPGDKVTIRLRLNHHDDAVPFLRSRNFDARMVLDEENEEFDYYRATIQVAESPIEYCFHILAKNSSENYFFDRYGINDYERPEYAFRMVPGFSTPEWAKGAVMYQILIDRFSNGDPSNDVEEHEYHYIDTYAHKITNWDQYPSDFDVANFYGGDLEGVKQRLYYLKGLGVEVIYFNPLFVSPSNHKYDTQDYDHVDPHYGRIVDDGGECLLEGDFENKHATKYIHRVVNQKNLEASNQFFADFVQLCHEKGIRVIIDGVFNHCGSFNKWLDRERIYEGWEGYDDGAYISKDSPYHDYFQFYPEGNWPYNGVYDGWWGHDTLPKLNYEGSDKLLNYILHIAAKWVSPPYNCDGWRLDMAADLGHSEEFNHKFWAMFRDAVKKANPNAVILAEHYGDAKNWLLGDEWDTIMNYSAFMEPVSYFLTGMEKHSDEIDESAIGDGKRFELTMRHFMAQFMTPSLYCAMNELSNHDHSRFLTRTNHKVGRVQTLGSEAANEGVNETVLMEATLLQMTWPGAPTIYYGDEAGVCGFTDPDNRRTYPWGHANYPLIDYFRDAISLHRLSPALRKGAFTFLSTGQNYISYARFTRDEKVVIALNSSEHDIEIDVPVWLAEVPKECTITRVFLTGVNFYSIMPSDYEVHNGILHLRLGPNAAIVLKKEM